MRPGLNKEGLRRTASTRILLRQTNPKEEGSQPQLRKMKLALLLVGIGLGMTLFLTLDWFHTAAIRHTTSNPCRVRDPIRHHAFQPNCGSIDHWGSGSSYEFLTNNIGFRDEQIREVPLADAPPRILILGD